MLHKAAKIKHGLCFNKLVDSKIIRIAAACQDDVTISK